MASVSKNRLAEGRALAHHPCGSTPAPGWAAPCSSPFPWHGRLEGRATKRVPEQAGPVSRSRSKYPEKSPRGCRCERLGTLSTVPSGGALLLPAPQPRTGRPALFLPKNSSPAGVGRLSKDLEAERIFLQEGAGGL